MEAFVNAQLRGEAAPEDMIQEPEPVAEGAKATQGVSESSEAGDAVGTDK